jgi:hypothetical protein
MAAEQAVCPICFLGFTKSNMARHKIRCKKASAVHSSSSESSFVADQESGSSDDESVVKNHELLEFWQHLCKTSKRTKRGELITILRCGEQYLGFGKKHASLIEPDCDEGGIVQTLTHCDKCCLSTPLLNKFFLDGLSHTLPATQLAYSWRLKRLITWRVGLCKQLSLMQQRLQAAFSSVLQSLSQLQSDLSKNNKQHQHQEHTIEKYEEKNEWTTLEEMAGIYYTS